MRRFGDTNSDLTVTYAIGGTASNGVDYVTLPGTVTIPAGQRAAMITVVPIDDGPPDITSTVILKLTPSANYLVDPRHSAAAAIILDGLTPAAGGQRAAGQMLPPQRALARMAPGAHVECTTDLRTWTPICTNQVFNGSLDFVDPGAQRDQVRFYRAGARGQSFRVTGLTRVELGVDTRPAGCNIALGIGGL